MRWRLILKYFGPEHEYIKIENNVVSNALSHIDMSDNQEIVDISEIYGYDDNDLTDSAYPISYLDIAKAQKTDAKLKQKLVSQKDYTPYNFCRGDQNHRFICQNSKISLPTAVQKKTILVS